MNYRKVKYSSELVKGELYRIHDLTVRFYGTYEGYDDNEDGYRFPIEHIIAGIDLYLYCILVVRPLNWNNVKIYKTTKAEKVLYSR
jgi:hypothetical protein